MLLGGRDWFRDTRVTSRRRGRCQEGGLGYEGAAFGGGVALWGQRCAKDGTTGSMHSFTPSMFIKPPSGWEHSTVMGKIKYIPCLHGLRSRRDKTSIK